MPTNVERNVANALAATVANDMARVDGRLKRQLNPRKRARLISSIGRLKTPKKKRKTAKIGMPTAATNSEAANNLPNENAQGQPETDDVDVLVSLVAISESNLL